MTLGEFADETRRDINEFVTKYEAAHAANPQAYPLELPADNAGVWLECFIFFMETGNV